jgi:hypothetical protein
MRKYNHIDLQGGTTWENITRVTNMRRMGSGGKMRTWNGPRV